MTDTINARLDPIVAELLDAEIPLAQALQVFEQKYLVAALQRKKGNVTKAALILGIHRNTMMNKRPVTERLVRARALREQRKQR